MGTLATAARTMEDAQRAEQNEQEDQKQKLIQEPTDNEPNLPDPTLEIAAFDVMLNKVNPTTFPRAQRELHPKA